ncbi:MAG: hypothetical protein H3C47_06985 [Candidatus Cloacimonetes bacterium]|nr:hypothetical protein [Candidatus Cloacimonadota bacterium]
MLRAISCLIFIFFQGRVCSDQSDFSNFEPVSWMKDFVLAHKEVYQTGSTESLKKLMHPGYLEVYQEQKFESLFWRRRESDSISVNGLDYKVTMAKILDWEYPKPNVLVMLGRWNSGVNLKVLRDGELLINRDSWSDNDMIFAIEKGEHGYQTVCTAELYKPLEVDPDEAKDVWKNSTLLCMEEDFGKTKRREWRLQILGFPPDQSGQMQEG